MQTISLPLVRKELRQSLRARAALIVENIYLLLLVIWAGSSVILATQAGVPLWESGRATFWKIAGLQSTLLALVAAAFTAAAVTTEREQKTEDLLLSTPARVRQIARSKLLATALIVLAFLTLSLPIAVICLLMGGLTWQEVGLAYLVTVLWLIFALSLGLLAGALFRRTIAAVPLAIIAVFLLDGFASGLAFAEWPHAVLAGSGALALVRNGAVLTFFKYGLPIAAAAALICLPLAACFTESALDRVRLPHRRRPVAQRIWLTVSVLAAAGLAIGKAITAPLPQGSPPWDHLLPWFYVIGSLFIIWAVIYSSQGLGRRDHAALLGQRQSGLDGLFGAGPRAGARWSLLLAAVVLGAFGICWVAAGPPIGVPAWRIALSIACLLAGVWLAALLSQVAAFWRLLRREWLRRTIASVFAALVFILPPSLAAWIWHHHEIPPTSTVVLLLSNPIYGCVLSLDPVGPMHGSPFAARANSVLTLGAYPLLFSVALAALVSLLLWRMRRRVQAALAAGLPPPEREAEESAAG